MHVKWTYLSGHPLLQLVKCCTHVYIDLGCRCAPSAMQCCCTAPPEQAAVPPLPVPPQPLPPPGPPHRHAIHQQPINGTLQLRATRLQPWQRCYNVAAVVRLQHIHHLHRMWPASQGSKSNRLKMWYKGTQPASAAGMQRHPTEHSPTGLTKQLSASFVHAGKARHPGQAAPLCHYNAHARQALLCPH